MPYASVSDVEVDFGPVPDAQVEKVETLLDRAEARIEQRVGPLADRLADGRTSVVLVKQVEAEMVTSVLRNPGGVRTQQQQEFAGPWQRLNLTTYDPSLLGSGYLDLTDRHLMLLGAREPVGPFVVPLGGL